MQVFNGIAELEQAVGRHLGHSAWRTVTQERIDRFADATGDHQWIHVDAGRAAAGPFGTTIAHGYLTLSLVPELAGEVYRVDGLAMSVNYGCNKVRFPSPVPAGSRVRAGVELLSVVPGPKGAQAVARVTVEREGGDKPVCVAETVSVMVP
ncbi:MaoC family dehydratase [Streptomyces sp. NPDC050388]|uniref:MaoC family dehydratase n=1 Tax=Streptomyces sp. NPDC050388 TaxID=3155781 RepID=UPI003430B288